MAKGLLRGAVGFLSKPVEGAEKAGLAGFFKGMGQVRGAGALL